ncbi:UNVERIFIED_ORG: hypothetical protein M2420_000695 [Stenotrophomonas maltophilia]
MAWIYSIAGICQRWGGVGLRGVRGMDAAAKPPWMGSRRPRNPTPTRQPTESPLLLLLLLLLLLRLWPLQVQGAALPNNPLPARQVGDQ